MFSSFIFRLWLGLLGLAHLGLTYTTAYVSARKILNYFHNRKHQQIKGFPGYLLSGDTHLFVMPVIRSVARMELPSHKHAITRVRSALLKRFTFSP